MFYPSPPPSLWNLLRIHLSIFCDSSCQSHFGSGTWLDPVCNCTKMKFTIHHNMLYCHYTSTSGCSPSEVWVPAGSWEDAAITAAGHLRTYISKKTRHWDDDGSKNNPWSGRFLSSWAKAPIRVVQAAPLGINRRRRHRLSQYAFSLSSGSTSAGSSWKLLAWSINSLIPCIPLVRSPSSCSDFTMS